MGGHGERGSEERGRSELAGWAQGGGELKGRARVDGALHAVHGRSTRAQADASLAVSPTYRVARLNGKGGVGVRGNRRIGPYMMEPAPPTGPHRCLRLSPRHRLTILSGSSGLRETASAGGVTACKCAHQCEARGARPHRPDTPGPCRELAWKPGGNPPGRSASAAVHPAPKAKMRAATVGRPSRGEVTLKTFPLPYFGLHDDRRTCRPHILLSPRARPAPWHSRH